METEVIPRTNYRSGNAALTWRFKPDKNSPFYKAVAS
jgi:hypothetical protein